MVGLIQKLFLDMIRQAGGEPLVDQIKKEADIASDQTYQINNIYPDEEWQRLLAAGLKVLNMTPEQADDMYADYFLNDAMKRFPMWFDMCKTAYDFLLIQPTIHNCFATSVIDKKDRDRINDKFVVDKAEKPNKLITHYRSGNHHCGFYKALARCLLKYYKDEAIIEETQCLKQGGTECEIHFNFSKLGNVSYETN